MNSISFDNVYLLLIAPLLIVLFTVPFALAVRKDNRSGHNVASYVLHVTMAVIIAFAAAGTNLTTYLTETDVYVVADVSYSARDKVDLIDGYIENLKLPRNSKLGLVCFGKDCEVVSSLGDRKNVASVGISKVDKTETNISKALEYTSTLFPSGVMKRIVLITDGRQTDLSSDNSIRRAVERLKMQNIKVDAIFLDDNIGADAKEVQISGVELNESVYLDSEQTVKVEVQTSYDTEAKMTLKKNGEEVETDRKVSLMLGLNSISFTLDTSEVGTFEYEVLISAEEDESDFNNSYLFSQTVYDEMNVLVLTQSWADCVTLVGRYGGRGHVDVYENDVNTTNSVKNNFIRQNAGNSNINIIINTTQMPYLLEDLCKYDEIVLADIDLGIIDAFTQFVASLDTAVSTYGKSLVTMGDLHIQNREDEDLKQLSQMLPVKFGNGDEEPKLYTFVVDDSRSMQFLYHLQTAKALMCRLLNVLNEKDYVTIIKFDSQVETVFRAKPISERDEIIETIENFEVANGTVIGKGLNQAYNEIKDFDFDEKQIMLITDGLTFGDDDDPIEVAKKMYDEGGIVTSIFDVGRQGDVLSNGHVSNVVGELTAAKERLEKVAEEGHGKYYYSNNVEYLDDVAFADVANDVSRSVIEEETSVNVELPRDAVLAGIDVRAEIPDVLGYVYSGIKPSAKTVLTVNHKRASGSTVKKPLYAYWNYGKGKVSSFTSSCRWTESWQNDLKNTLFDNIYETGVPSQKHSIPYSVSLERDGKKSHLEIEIPTLRLSHSAAVELTLPSGETVTEDMTFDGSVFFYDFETAEVGRYTVDITYSYNNIDYITRKLIYVSYLEEYNAFAVFEPSELSRAIDDDVGTVIDKEGENLEIKNNPDEMGKYEFSFTVPLLIVAVALFVVDIVIRKLKWEDIKSLFGYGKNKEVKK